MGIIIIYINFDKDVVETPDDMSRHADEADLAAADAGHPEAVGVCVRQPAEPYGSRPLSIQAFLN